MKSSFQTIVIIIFGAGFVLAVAVFSGLFSSNTGGTTTDPEGNVSIWGILPRETMEGYLEDFNNSNAGYTVSYEEHAPETFTRDLVNALADGLSPDLVIFSSEIFSEFKNKLYVIPYVAYSERSYRDVNVDGAQIFLGADGIIGLPIVVDPLVVYYNKDILAAANFVVPPYTWGNLTRTIPVFTKKNAQNLITQSTIALGDTTNVNHMSDILSTLFLQTGNPIVAYDSVLRRNQVTLTSNTSYEESPVAQAVTFYTSFSNTTNSNYSWNRSLDSSLQMFLSGRSAFYVGRASELFTIQQQNPNLNFDVQEMFQSETAVRPITFGSFVGVGIMKNAPNFTAAYSFLTQITTKESIDGLSKALSLPPVRRDLLLLQQNNPYVSVFFRAALSAFTWPNPNSARTDEIFRGMITDVTSGRSNATTAIYEATRDLQSSIQ